MTCHRPGIPHADARLQDQPKKEEEKKRRKREKRKGISLKPLSFFFFFIFFSFSFLCPDHGVDGLVRVGAGDLDHVHKLCLVLRNGQGGLPQQARSCPAGVAMHRVCKRVGSTNGNHTNRSAGNRGLNTRHKVRKGEERKKEKRKKERKNTLFQRLSFFSYLLLMSSRHLVWVPHEPRDHLLQQTVPAHHHNAVRFPKIQCRDLGKGEKRAEKAVRIFLSESSPLSGSRSTPWPWHRRPQSSPPPRS
jgi:hypothetical protein